MATNYSLLSPAKKHALVVSFSCISENLYVGSVLNELLSMQSLTPEEYAIIRSKLTEHDKADIFMTILMKKRDQDFDNFITALDSSGQGHLSDKLRTEVSTFNKRNTVTKHQPLMDTANIPYIFETIGTALKNLHPIDYPTDRGTVKIVACQPLYVTENAVTSNIKARDLLYVFTAKAGHVPVSVVEEEPLCPRNLEQLITLYEKECHAIERLLKSLNGEFHFSIDLQSFNASWRKCQLFPYIQRLCYTTEFTEQDAVSSSTKNESTVAVVIDKDLERLDIWSPKKYDDEVLTKQQINGLIQLVHLSSYDVDFGMMLKKKECGIACYLYRGQYIPSIADSPITITHKDIIDSALKTNSECGPIREKIHKVKGNLW